MEVIPDNKINSLTKNGRIIIYRDNYIYDVTDFIHIHPGGKTSLFLKNLKDCSADYKFHSKNAKQTWNNYLI